MILLLLSMYNLQTEELPTHRRIFFEIHRRLLDSGHFHIS